MNESEQKKSKTIAQRVGAALLALTMGATPVAALSEEDTNAQTVSGTTINAVLESPMDITRYEKGFNEFYMSPKVDHFYNKLCEIIELPTCQVNYNLYITALSCIYYANAIVNDETVYGKPQNEIFFTPEEILSAMTILDPSFKNLCCIYGFKNIIPTTKIIEASKSFYEKLYTFFKYSKIPFPFELLTIETKSSVDLFKKTNASDEKQCNIKLHALETIGILKEVSSLIAEINIGREDGTPDIECSDKLLAKIYELYVEDENKMPTLGYGAQIMCNAMIKAFVDTATEEELTLHQDMGNAPKGMCIKVDGEDIMTVVNGEEVRISSADDKNLKKNIHTQNNYAYESNDKDYWLDLISTMRNYKCGDLIEEYFDNMNDETLLVLLTKIETDDTIFEGKEITPEEIADLKDKATKVSNILNTASPCYTELLETMDEAFDISKVSKEETPTAQLTEPPKVVKANSSQLENMKLTLGNNEKPTMKRKM